VIDLDEAWQEKDVDQNGYLDKEECRSFLSKIKNFIVPLRAQNYDEDDFDELFQKFDQDKNSFIEKGEMAVFIKKVFRRTPE